MNYNSTFTKNENQETKTDSHSPYSMRRNILLDKIRPEQI